MKPRQRRMYGGSSGFGWCALLGKLGAMRVIKSVIKREVRGTIVHPVINISAGSFNAFTFFRAKPAAT